MKIVQSFQAKYNNIQTNFIQSVCYTLSYLYCRKIGLDITLHTDNVGKDILDYIPYKNIYTTLENIDRFNEKLYAYPKIHIIEREPLGTLHIDGDVFLKKESIKELLDFKDYDVIVQSYEDKTKFGYLYDESISAFEKVDFPLWASKSCECMYNTGILGFNNEDIRRKFVYAYEKTARAYNKDGNKLIKQCPDIIIEQKFLYDLTQYFKSNVKTLLNYDNIYEHAKEIGYTHVLSRNSKIKNLSKMIDRIYELDNDIYMALKNKWSNNYKYMFIYG